VERIPPGQEGKITVKFSTGGYGGKEVKEVVKIRTNDLTKPGLSVVVKGFVENFAEISPVRARLMGKAGEPVSTQITITPRIGYPFTITNTRTQPDSMDYTYRLDKQKQDDQIIYVLSITNTKKEPGMYTGRVILETDSAVKPRIIINVMGMISP